MASIDKVLAREGLKSVKAQTAWEYELHKIKTACDNAPRIPDVVWAHARCFQSEELHAAVWRWEPDNSDVESKVIPELERALELMQSAKVEEEDKNLLGRYIDNMQSRIDNLRNNYLKGLPSGFRPDSRAADRPQALKRLQRAKRAPKRIPPKTSTRESKARPGKVKRGTRKTAKKHIFIAYCHDNTAEVAKLCDDLIAADETVWWDQKILPGQDWKLEIRKAMKNSRAVVVCLSKELVRREKSGVYPEISDAIEIFRQFPPGSIFLIPIRLSDCSIPPIEIDARGTLKRLHYVDLFPAANWDAGLDHLVAALRATAGHP